MYICLICIHVHASIIHLFRGCWSYNSVFIFTFNCVCSSSACMVTIIEPNKAVCVNLAMLILPLYVYTIDQVQVPPFKCVWARASVHRQNMWKAVCFDPLCVVCTIYSESVFAVGHALCWTSVSITGMPLAPAYVCIIHVYNYVVKFVVKNVCIKIR